MKKLLDVSFFPVKLVVKFLIFLIVLVLTLAQWIGFVAASVTAWIFRGLGVIIMATGVMSFAFGFDSSAEMWKLVLVGTVFFLIPEIMEWFVVRIASVNHLVRRRLL